VAKNKPPEDRRADPGWVATQLTEEMAAALREGLDKAIATAGPDYGAALERLQQSVERTPRFDLLCFLSLYFLTTEAGTNPEFNRPQGVFQHHVDPPMSRLALY
jgi:hypothetical protein